MNDNVIPIDRAKRKNTTSTGTWYAEHEGEIRTGPYATQELSNQALDEDWHLKYPALRVKPYVHLPEDDFLDVDGLPF